MIIEGRSPTREVAYRETPQFKAGYYGDVDEDRVDRRAFAAWTATEALRC